MAEFAFCELFYILELYCVGFLVQLHFINIYICYYSVCLVQLNLVCINSLNCHNFPDCLADVSSNLAVLFVYSWTSISWSCIR